MGVMSHEDFDVDRLAEYIHLRADQVVRLAERGKLPGRRIAGQWKFSKGEIHQWWEERIGGSDEDELAEVETVLQGSGADELSPVSLSALLPTGAIALHLEARTRSSVITAMVKLASQTGFLWDEEKMEEAVRARESLHPTALDNGIALLHPRRPLGSILSEPFLAIGRTVSGIRFGGGPTLTDVFFLICSCDDRGHLRILARLSRLVADTSFLMRFRELENARDARSLIEEYERKLVL
jgi:PTS system nitrogen regulatory IIA component